MLEENRRMEISDQESIRDSFKRPVEKIGNRS